MVRRKIAFRKKRQNRLGMLMVMTVLAMLLVVVTVKSFELRAKQETYQAREQALLEQIEAEEKRTEEIEEYRKYTQTKKYVEEVAKDKLGLVYEGEIVFKEK
ncbi:MAG: septum formation initiator family protein [Lachnospiraceae bacterium]|nr:septum formation initiator family protein [Lachnospiraceae bacterium]